MRPLRLGLALVALLLLLRSDAEAHPIAQGSLDLDVGPGAIRVRARVPIEEVFLAGGASQADTFKAHGDYLARHLRIEADGRALAPVVTEILPNDGRNGFVTYELAYTPPTPPSRIGLAQDLLREIEYAPGNSWEVTYVVRMTRSGKLAQEGLLLSAAHPLELACGGPSTGHAPLDRPRLFREYLGHGIRHILRGYDHLLFIMALVLAARSFWDVLKVVSAFTLAHSVTLTLSVLDILRLPSRVVEPMIAASIVVVAVSNVFWPERRRGFAWLATAFFFGLFHGLGFAGGLLDAMGGFAGAAVGLAIVAFSLGVEMGHQMIVLPLYFALRAARSIRAEEAARDRLSLAMIRGGSMAISLAGLVYLVAALRYAGGT
jgi:hydrogenase/urease accessory protein HupE